MHWRCAILDLSDLFLKKLILLECRRRRWHPTPVTLAGDKVAAGVEEARTRFRHLQLMVSVAEGAESAGTPEGLGPSGRRPEPGAAGVLEIGRAHV